MLVSAFEIEAGLGFRVRVVVLGRGLRPGFGSDSGFEIGVRAGSSFRMRGQSRACKPKPDFKP